MAGAQKVFKKNTAVRKHQWLICYETLTLENHYLVVQDATQWTRRSKSLVIVVEMKWVKGKCQNSIFALFERNWKMSESEIERICKCDYLKVRELENG